MASAPSASALSAVLRCRGNIFNKKRPGSGYSLGPKCGTPGEPVASSACSESRQPRLAWRALLFGGHAEARDGIPVVIRWQLLRKVLTDRSREAGAPVSGRHRRTEAQIPCKRSAAAPASAGRGPKRGSGFADTVLLALGPGKGTSPREPRNGRIAGAALDQSAPKTCLFVQCLLKSKGFSDDYGPPVRLRAVWASLKGGCSLLNALLSDLLRRRFIVADGSRCIHGIFKVDDQRATFAKSQDPSSSYNDCHTVIGFKGRRRPTSLEVEGGSPKSTSCPKTSTVSGK
ncbi:uncharacterized protein LOC125749590 [Brienomyrus brachyistius]|uniref:uncharacterized protein LOC125749590 n=1 Tax=Brienomyrus brachyistius TaxID=42636 RepID=UPI0020B35DE5|nr:uncharacterized protein LOC125749590 [Brienomyrus brachyistius]